MTRLRYTTGIFRERLWARYEKFGPDPFLDEEFLALCLSLFLRRNPLPVGRSLLERFQNLPGVFDAPVEDLAQVPGMTLRAARFLHLVKQAGSRYLKARMIGKDALGSPADVVAYARHALSGLRHEVFMLIYLDTKNQILATQILFEGTIDRTAVHTRRVIETALQHNAAGLVFVHNHPSESIAPSQSDRELTDNLIAACQAVELVVLDHIIVGRSGYFSFLEQGWLATRKAGVAPAANP